MRRYLVCVLVVVLATAPGCALPFRGTTTGVTITCNVPNARLRVDGNPIQAGLVELKRGDDHVVIADAPGYRSGRATIKSEASYGFLIPEAIFAFISVWFSVPLLVDAISGALYNLNPEAVNLQLERDEDAPAGDVGAQAPTPQNGRPAVEPGPPSREAPASAPRESPPTPDAPPPTPDAPPPAPNAPPAADAPPAARADTCVACGASMGPRETKCATCGERRR